MSLPFVFKNSRVLALGLPAELELGTPFEFVSVHDHCRRVARVLEHVELESARTVGVLSFDDQDDQATLLKHLVGARGAARVDGTPVVFDVHPEVDREIVDESRVPHVDLVVRLEPVPQDEQGVSCEGGESLSEVRLGPRVGPNESRKQSARSASASPNRPRRRPWSKRSRSS